MGSNTRRAYEVVGFVVISTARSWSGIGECRSGVEQYGLLNKGLSHLYTTS